MNNDDTPASKPAKKTRANKTYKKKLTKKQLKNRKRQILIVLIATLLGVGIISAYGQNTVRHFDKLTIGSDVLIPKIEKAQAKGIEVVDVSTGTIREITAYNSVEWQTDSTPCIAADGTDICLRYQAGECIIAANFVPLGTKLYIDKIGLCTVADRMNKRYSNRVDIFFDKDVERATKFGLQRLLVK